MSAFIPHSRPTLGEEEAKATAEVVLSGQIAQGPQVARFEEELASYIGVGYGVAVSSGTAALTLALRALGIGEGDEVAVPSYACAALVQAVWSVGAIPLLVDVDPRTGNMDPDDLRRRATPKARAVVLVHMFGFPAEVEDIARMGLPVVEDCAMAIGARLRGRPLGSFGLASAFSFYATKMMATGEGGMVATDDPEVAQVARDLREYDMKEDLRPRFNFKMTDLQAALGRVQLKKLEKFLARRREIAALYDAALAGAGVELPLRMPDAEPAYYRYVVRVDRDAGEVVDALKAGGIGAARPVFRPLHRYLGLPSEDFPGTEEIYRRAVSLPIYPSLTEEEVRRVIREVQAILEG